MPWLGLTGQARLESSSVLIVGCGGTGCACASFLARAGVGTLTLIDGDVVERVDLHRQILYDEADAAAAAPKSHAAARKLASALPGVELKPVAEELTTHNVVDLASQIDLVIDCTDNFGTRLLINDVCLKHAIPWIHGACVSTMGMVIPFPVSPRACYRCIIRDVETLSSLGTCQDIGILGPLAGLVGCIEAVEAVKMLVNPKLVQQRMIYIDGLSYTYEVISVKGAEDCPACKRCVYRYLERPSQVTSREECGTDSLLLRLGEPIDLGRIRRSISGADMIADWGDALTLMTGGSLIVLFGDGRAIVRDAADLGEARARVSEIINR
jgi:adenylyltransferase/sulfurtransferase